MPRLVALYIRQVLIGFALGAAFTGLLLWSNAGNLRHLVTHTTDGPLAVALLVVFNGIVFSGVQFGIAVMRLAGRDGGSGSGSRAPVPAVRAAPLRVRH